jgi:hypothetical protein
MDTQGELLRHCVPNLQGMGSQRKVNEESTPVHWYTDEGIRKSWNRASKGSGVGMGTLKYLANKGGMAMTAGSDLRL